MPAPLTRLRRADPILVLIVLAGALATAWLTLRCKQYFIQPDELEYVKQARRIASQLHPVLPGDRYFSSWSQLQPLLMAPVWGMLSPNAAHEVQGLVNAVVMASTAIPAYLLGRRVIGSRWAAYGAAALTVAIPWMAAATTMMTEVAAYPAFVWAVFAAQHAVARPSPRADVMALGGVILAFAARPQLAVVGPAFLAAVVAQELRYARAGVPGRELEPRRARVTAALRRHAVLGLVALPAALLAVVLRARVFGGYAKQGVTDNVLGGGVLESTREVLSYLTVGVGLLPVALAVAWLAVTVVRPSGRDQHAFAWVTLVSAVPLLLAVGSFTARIAPGINSRYVFYLAPLLFIAMAACLHDRRPLSVPIAVGSLATGLAVWGSALAQTGPSLVSPDQTFHTVLAGRTYQLGAWVGLYQLSVPHLLGAATIAAGLLLAIARRRWWRSAAGLVAVGLVAVWCVLETGYAFRKIADTQAGVDPAFVSGRSWIDAALPAGETAQVILSDFGAPASAPAVWWDVTFWNARVDRSLVLPNLPDLQQPYPEFFHVNADGSTEGAAQELTGRPGPGLGRGSLFVRAVTDRTMAFAGTQILAERFGVQLMRIATPPRVEWELRASDSTGRLALGSRGTLLVYGAGAHTLTVRLKPDPAAQRPVRVGIGRAAVTLRPGSREVTLTVPVPPPTRAGNRVLSVRTTGAPTPAAPAAGAQVTGVGIAARRGS